MEELQNINNTDAKVVASLLWDINDKVARQYCNCMMNIFFLYFSSYQMWMSVKTLHVIRMATVQTPRALSIVIATQGLKEMGLLVQVSKL